MKTVRCGEGGGTASATTHRQTAYRLLPQRRAAWRRLEAILEDQRQLYSAALEERIGCCRKTGKGLSYSGQCRALTECRRDIPGMAACPVAVQRGTLKRLDEAFRAFFRRVKAGGAPGFPKFRGRRSFDSFSAVSGVRIRGGRIHIPGLGGMAVRRKGGNPYPDGKPLSAVLKRTGGKRFVSVCCAVQAEGPADSGHAVGVDRNAGQVAGSDGVIHAMPDMARLEAKCRRLARRVSRRRKGSRRRERAKRQLAKARRKAADRRRSWQHHVSRRLAERAGTVVLERLDVRGMTRSAKGTADEPGRNVGQKAGLNRAIAGTGWTAFAAMLECKAANVIHVPAAYTSQTCHECGAADAASRGSQAESVCVACGHAASADVNAAKNIPASGTGASARRGAFASATPMTREISTEAA